MTKRRDFTETIKTWTPEKRLVEANRHFKRMVDSLLEVVALHEVNRYLVFSKEFEKKIPRHKAYGAFHILRIASYRYEILRMLALWDPADYETASIFTIQSLVNDPAVMELLLRETIQHHADSRPALFNPDPDPEIAKLVDEQIALSQLSFGVEQAKKAEKSLGRIFARCTAITKDKRFHALRLARDKFIAHNLHKSRAERKISSPRLKLGDEFFLYDASLLAVEKLNLWINGTSFDIRKESPRIHRAEADALFKNIRFV